MSKEHTIEEFGYKQELKRSLTLWDLVFYGMIVMVPIAPFGIYGYTVTDSKGMIALVYIVGIIAMIFTALSYARMSEAFPIAGSVYSYASHAINDNVGFLVGWGILLDYILVPALLYLVSAAALYELVPQIPMLVWALLFVGINTCVNILGIEFTAKFNKITIILELIILGIFLLVGGLAIYKKLNGIEFTIKPVYDATQFSPKLILSAVSLAVLSFLGFDAISTMSEETKGGNKVVGKATIIALLVVGVLFVLQTWVAALIIPDYKVFANKDIAFYDVAFAVGGTPLKLACQIATIFSWGIANALGAQTATARILYSMSRDKCMPKFLGKIHPKFKTPYAALLFVAFISAIVIFFFTNSIDGLTYLVNFGALLAFMVLNCCVVVKFIIKDKSKDFWNHLILPIAGFIIIAFVFVQLGEKSLMMGGIWLVIGVFYLIYLNKTNKKLVL